MEKPIIIANWKMNPETLKEAKKLFKSSLAKIKKIKEAKIVLCPPFVYFSLFPKKLSKNIKIGAQNVFQEEKGAFTGEISSLQLSSVDCSYVIVGHSERRKYFKETDQTINQKIKAVLDQKMIPILCVGETKIQRDAGEMQTVLKRELQEGLRGISANKIKKTGLLVAYEPIWAIGTGRPCDTEEAQKMNLLIKKILSGIYSSKIINNTKILYGGSVKSKNAANYVKEAGFEGLLVGGASLNASEFSKIVKNSL